jgi:hypothetical protein
MNSETKPTTEQEGYDIIGIAMRGIKLAYHHYKACKERGENVRFLTFYPASILAEKGFCHVDPSTLIEEMYEEDLNRLNRKLSFFKKGVHKDIEKYISITTLSEFDKTVFDEKHYNKFKNLDSLEFIYSPEIRLSEKADPKRKVTLIDNYAYGGSTLRSTLVDLLGLGYEEIHWWTETHNPGITFWFNNDVTNESVIYGHQPSDLFSKIYGKQQFWTPPIRKQNSTFLHNRD